MASISKNINGSNPYQYHSIQTPSSNENTSVTNSTQTITSENNNETKQGYFLSLILENKGSVARDHLANERTFLAWLRTSLALVTLGIAITQLSKLTSPQPNIPNAKDPHLYIGSLYIIGGILFISFGLFRYFFIQNSLTKNKFPISRIGVTLGVAFIFVVTTVLLYTFFF